MRYNDFKMSYNSSFPRFFCFREIKHHQEFIFFERPRDVLPPLMQKRCEGNSYFVTQRRASAYEIPKQVETTEKRLQYMSKGPQADEKRQIKRAPSRKTSYTESIISDTWKYPETLRKPLAALEMLNNYQSGRMLMMPNKDL